MEDNIIDGVPEEELWLSYVRDKDQGIRDKLIIQYAPLVKYVAGKISVGLPASVDFDDLVSFGTFGLLDAIEKFDPGKRVKFKTYAVRRVRGAIFDELRSMDWIPRSVRQKSKEIEGTIQRLEAKLGRAVSDHEIAAALHISLAELSQTLMKIGSLSIVSLYDTWHGAEDDKLPLLDSIESPSLYQPEEIAEREEIKRVLVHRISELPDKEKKVLILYYYEDLTLKEIGSVMEVTESRVSQLHTKAIMRLKGRLTTSKKGIV